MTTPVEPTPYVCGVCGATCWLVDSTRLDQCRVLVAFNGTCPHIPPEGGPYVGAAWVVHHPVHDGCGVPDRAVRHE